MSAKPEVSVYIQTYQQIAYIRDAIEGVVSQRAPFELEIVIADDCSSDGTRELLAEYRDRHPELIRLLLPERNLGPTEIFRRGTAELRGRYVAWLDGDDYWTDPEKLVRQVESLRANPQWAGCFHDATVHQVDGGAPDRPYVSDEVRGPLGFADLLRSNPVPSLSLMARGELVRGLPDWVWEGLWADWLSLLAIAQHGELGYLPEQLGVYRVHTAGISSGLSRAEQLEEDLRFYELIDPVVDERHRPELERAVRSRRCQIAVEEAGVPFSGAVGVLAAAAETPNYLNGRQVWQLEATATGALRCGWRKCGARPAAPSRASPTSQVASDNRRARRKGGCTCWRSVPQPPGSPVTVGSADSCRGAPRWSRRTTTTSSWRCDPRLAHRLRWAHS
jgi:glycosyltransferase involved in cell wall biosynthesis